MAKRKRVDQLGGKTLPSQLDLGGLGARVLGLRKELGLSQQALADRVGVHLNTIVAIEKGADPSLSNALRLAVALGVTLNDLVDQGETVERLRLIRLLTDPGETPDDVTVEMMRHLRQMMARADGNGPG